MIGAALVIGVLWGGLRQEVLAQDQVQVQEEVGVGVGVEVEVDSNRSPGQGSPSGSARRWENVFTDGGLESLFHANETKSVRQRRIRIVSDHIRHPGVTHEGEISGSFLINGDYLSSWQESNTVLPVYKFDEKRQNLALKTIGALKPNQIIGKFKIENFETINNITFGKSATFTSYILDNTSSNNPIKKGSMQISVKKVAVKENKKISPLPYQGKLTIRDSRLIDKKFGAYSGEYTTNILDNLDISEAARLDFNSKLAALKQDYYKDLFVKLFFVIIIILAGVVPVFLKQQKIKKIT